MGGKGGDSGGPSRQDVVKNRPSGSRHFDPSKESWEAYIKYLQGFGGSSSGGGGFELPSFEFGSGGEDIAAQLEEQRKEIERETNLTSLDELWSARNQAVGDAIGVADARIGEEAASAAVLGTRFKVSKKQRNKRINNAFADVWSVNDAARLEGLATKYGNPEQDEATRAAVEAGTLAYAWDYQVRRATPEADRDPAKAKARLAKRRPGRGNPPRGKTEATVLGAQTPATLLGGTG